MKMLSATVLLFTVASLKPEPRYLRYERAVQTPAKAAAQTCVPLDATVFEHAARDHTDLRLYLNDREVPYRMVVASAAATGPRLVLPLNAGVRNGRTEFDAAMPPGTYGDVELQISKQNFQAKVEVTGSETPSTSGARTIGRYSIFDLKEEKSGRSTVLHLPPSDFRYLHFSIDGPIAPEAIAGMTVLSGDDDAEPPYTTVAQSTAAKQGNRDTTYTFSVPARVPVDRVQFDPGPEPAYFRRNVTVTVVPAAPGHEEDGEAAGPRIFHGTLLRQRKIEGGEIFRQENESVPVPSQISETQAKWTVSVDNGDDQPLQPGPVQLQMLQRELCFASAGEASYVLRYGDAALPSAEYDYVAQFSRNADTAAATLGPERVNSSWQQRPDTRAFTERHPWLLWVALIAVIALLGFVALRSRRD